MTRRRWLLVGGLVVVLWVAVAGFLLLRAAGDLRAGRDAAESARHGLDAEAITDGTPLPLLRRAHDRFRSASSATGSPLLLPARFLPVVGRQLRSVHAMSGAATEVTAAAVEAVARAHEVLGRSSSGGASRLEQVRALSDAVSKAHRRVAAVDDLGPRVGLVGPLVKARNQLASQLAQAKESLADATAGAHAGLRLLEGPGRYLVIAANTSEMRAGSGMWLSGGVLSTEGGRLDLGPMAPLSQQADPPNGAVAITDKDVLDRWGELWHPNWDWRALMTSPRMPASAELGLRMWEAAGREPIDGVLVVDPVALAAVVRATRPVDVAGRTVTADEVVPLLANEQYQQFGSESREQGDRREMLGSIASAAFRSLDEGDWSPSTLAGELASAAKGRHLLAWSASPLEQDGWVAAGLAGDLQADSLFVSVLNRGGNKLDYFLPGDGRITTRRVGSDTQVTATLTLRNVTPGGQPRYVVGPPFEQTWEPGRYVGVVSVDVPAAAEDVRIVGLDPVTQGRDGAAQVIAAEVQIPAGQSKEVVVTFRMPGIHGALHVEPSARHPGITWHHGGRSWEDVERQTAKW